jgi:D-beta-D-heptose 7-phosphate kinase/D-beta-D-heptose 1-phosphate adenosyltransferase
MNDLHTLLNSLGKPRLLVVGDLILDRYTWGEVTRVSPEAPVLVLRADREEVRPGGAASVAALLRALDANVTLAGVVGDDVAGRVLRKLLQDEGVAQDVVLCDAGRPTTSKERLMGRAAHRHPQQILRVDREETHPLPTDVEQHLLQAILSQVDQHAAVLVSDYAKGVCTPALLGALIARAAAHGIPVFVDPARITDYARYRGATVLAPNRAEAELATGRKIRTAEDALAAAHALRDLTACGTVLLKVDRDGMVLVTDSHPGRVYPTQRREVYDVTGAGDMVLAMIGLCRASGVDWDGAVPLANLAAGLEVEKLGVALLTRAEIRLGSIHGGSPRKLLSLDDMEPLAEAYRRQGKKLVFTNGCFDLLHVGHTHYLREAACLGDVLIVAVNSDASVRRLKGNDRPVIREADRAAMLAALACVAHVMIFEEQTPHELLRRLRPDVLVKGGTYTVEQVVGREVVEGYGGTVCVVGKLDGVSTTEILASVRNI